jgi:nucleotide-binding universal stress UspA family protein
MNVRRILHPSDFSRASEPAFEKAVAMAKADRAELLLAHVVAYPAPVLGDGYISPKIYDDLTRSVRAAGQKQLDKLVAKATASGVKARGLLLEGMPAEAINQGGPVAAGGRGRHRHPRPHGARAAVHGQRGRARRRWGRRVRC